MNSISFYKKWTKEKVFHEVEAFINYFGIEHCLFGTLTLRGFYTNESVSDMWRRFANRISPLTKGYYGVVDNSKPNTPHIHFLLAVEHDVRAGMDMVALGHYHAICQKERSDGLLPSERMERASLKASLGSNPVLAHYRAKVKRFKELAGFSPIFDLSPIYSSAGAIAGYLRKAYTQAALRKGRRTTQRCRRLVFASRLPEGILKKRGSFTVLTPMGRQVRDAQTAVARAFGLPIGDSRIFQYYFMIDKPSDWTGALWEFINSTPRRKGHPYPTKTVRRFFSERFQFQNQYVVSLPERRGSVPVVTGQPSVTIETQRTPEALTEVANA